LGVGSRPFALVPPVQGFLWGRFRAPAGPKPPPISSGCPQWPAQKTCSREGGPAFRVRKKNRCTAPPPNWVFGWGGGGSFFFCPVPGEIGGASVNKLLAAPGYPRGGLSIKVNLAIIKQIFSPAHTNIFFFFKNPAAIVGHWKQHPYKGWVPHRISGGPPGGDSNPNSVPNTVREKIPGNRFAHFLVLPGFI